MSSSFPSYSLTAGPIPYREGDHETELEALGGMLEEITDPHRELNAAGAAAVLLGRIEKDPLCAILDAAVRRGVRRALTPGAQSNAMGVAILVRCEVADSLKRESTAAVSSIA